MIESNAAKHIRTAGGLHVALGILAVLTAILLLVAVPVMMAGLEIAEREANSADERDFIEFMQAAGPAVLVFFALLALLVGVLGLIGGFGIMNGDVGKRGVAYAASALQLFNFPFGTIVAIYTFIALGMQGADEHFGPVYLTAA